MFAWKGRYSLLLALVLGLCGCASVNKLETRLVANANKNVCSIAVLPFENWTRNNELSLLATRIFDSELVQSGHYNVVQEGDVGMFLLRQRLLPGTLLHKEHYAALENQLDLDAVVLGRITEAGRDSRYGGEPVPFLALHVDLYDARTGQLLLNSVHQRWGDDYRKIMHFGVVTTSSGLMKKVSREIINDWSDKGVICQ